MKIGISTACFYPEPTENALERIAKLGATRTEIFFNSPSELRGDLYRHLLRIRAETGIEVRALHPYTTGFEPFLLFSEYRRRFEDTLEDYKRFAAAAAGLGARYLVIHGDKADGRLPEEEYFERFSLLRRVCLENGAEPLQENVNRFRSQSPDFVRRMKAALGDVGFVFDVKQCVRAGTDPFEMLDVMGTSVRHLHLSDHDETRSCLLPGRGRFDFARLFSCVYTMLNPDICMLIEVYRSGFGEPDEIGRALQYLAKLDTRYGTIP